MFKKEDVVYGILMIVFSTLLCIFMVLAIFDKMRYNAEQEGNIKSKVEVVKTIEKLP